MSDTDYPGIDYSLGDGTNRDPETGISFGVISMNSLSEWAWEEFEGDYGDPTCPKCGTEVLDSEDEEVHEDYRGDRDYWCPHCERTLDSEDCFGDEPVGYIHLSDDEYSLQVDSDGDLWVLKSPYFAHAQWCSPCCPGAGYLGSPYPTGSKTLCLDKTWFTDDKCPYPYWNVKTGKLVYTPDSIVKDCKS